MWEISFAWGSPTKVDRRVIAPGKAALLMWEFCWAVHGFCFWFCFGIFWFLFLWFFGLFVLRASELQGVRGEEERQADCLLSREPLVASIPRPWVYDLSRNHLLDWLSHPGAPGLFLGITSASLYYKAHTYLLEAGYVLFLVLSKHGLRERDVQFWMLAHHQSVYDHVQVPYSSSSSFLFYKMEMLFLLFVWTVRCRWGDAPHREDTNSPHTGLLYTTAPRS